MERSGWASPVKGFLQVALDWTPRNGTSQRWVTRRTYSYTRTRVRSTESRPWEVEFYCDVNGIVQVRDARTGEVMYRGEVP